MLDVNDNCPILNTTGYVFEPVPALQIDPIIYLNATDADTAGLNAHITYTASTPYVEWVLGLGLIKTFGIKRKLCHSFVFSVCGFVHFSIAICN